MELVCLALALALLPSSFDQQYLVTAPVVSCRFPIVHL
jgi:hypothetical protein